MRFIVALVFAGSLLTGTLLAAPRFVVDDEEYVDKVIQASARLLKDGKLKSAKELRQEVRACGVALNLAPLCHQKPPPPDLCERLRKSTLAVGNYYKCPECHAWHFNSSAGFVVGKGGIVATCCHVVTAEEEGVQESYLVAADDRGEVFPVESVLAADPEADTCFVKINAPLQPLPLRPGVRTGERVYCLSHPGGYFYMFTQGIVSRVNLKRNEMFDEQGRTNGVLTRPILLLNVTSEFAPGSSGAPVTDEAGNVVGQVASIADAGEPEMGATNGPPSPSVPIRFCTAAEELLGLAMPDTRIVHKAVRTNNPAVHPKLRTPH